jgi:hypothetical protein
MTTGVTTSLAADIRREHDLAQQSLTSAVDHAVRCGALLTEAKAGVAHGEWLPWLAENFPADVRTAQAYMRLAANAQRASHLEAAPSIRAALAELAEPRETDFDPDAAARALRELEARLDAAGDDIGEVRAVCEEADAWEVAARRAALRARRGSRLDALRVT